MLPSYTISEAARYLDLPIATVRSWVIGRSYPTQAGTKRFHPIITAADKKKNILSFINLVEIHLLSAIRRKHSIQLSNVRKAIKYLSREFRSSHPLADHKLATDGMNLFVEKYGQLINISKEGQLAIQEILNVYLRRVERDSSGLPISLYPFTRSPETGSPKSVVIDPSISFGRPVLAGTGVPTTVIAERYKSGDSIEELADDYGRSTEEIQEAIRLELSLRAA